MQRIIKFRAYHKPTGKMFYPDDDLEGILHYDYIQHEDELVLLPSGEIALFNSDRTYLRVCSDFIPLEYTGLKDKLGREIYEGDIVKRMDSCYAIYWHEFTACWRMTGHTGITKGDMALMCEVTGNIYENPSLLKG